MTHKEDKPKQPPKDERKTHKPEKDHKRYRPRPLHEYLDPDYDFEDEEDINHRG